MGNQERPFVHPFPNIAWYRPGGEVPGAGDLPTAATTTLLDPLEKAILARRNLLGFVEGSNLGLPLRGTGTADLISTYEIVSRFLTASNSRERHQAKRQVKRLLESDSGLLSLDKVLEAQTTLPTPLIEVKAKVDELLKPPTNFTVLGIFQPHRIEAPEEVPLLRFQIVSAGRQLFSKVDDNIFFLEDSRGDFFNNPDFYDAFEAYGSVRKAYSFVDERNRTKLPEHFSQLSRRQREIIDKLVDLNGQVWDSVAENPESDPEKAYLWTEFGAIDQLIGEGYPVQITWEAGKSERWIPRDENLTPEENIKNLMQNMALLQKRGDGKADQGISQQIVDAEKNKDKSKQTNMIIIFGASHIASINYLPTRLQAVTTHHFQP